MKEEVREYVLTDSEGGKVALSTLFGKKDDLILVHNMGRSCPYCTMWADGFNGVLDHLEDRAAFGLVSPDAPPVQKKFAGSRGWKFKMFSSKGTSFSKDMGFEGEEGSPEPGVSVFHRTKTGVSFECQKTNSAPATNTA